MVNLINFLNPNTSLNKKKSHINFHYLNTFYLMLSTIHQLFPINNLNPIPLCCIKPRISPESRPGNRPHKFQSFFQRRPPHSVVQVHEFPLEQQQNVSLRRQARRLPEMSAWADKGRSHRLSVVTFEGSNPCFLLSQASQPRNTACNIAVCMLLLSLPGQGSPSRGQATPVSRGSFVGDAEGVWFWCGQTERGRTIHVGCNKFVIETGRAQSGPPECLFLLATAVPLSFPSHLLLANGG